MRYAFAPRLGQVSSFPFRNKLRNRIREEGRRAARLGGDLECCLLRGTRNRRRDILTATCDPNNDPPV
jgi:hypothetical protein